MFGQPPRSPEEVALMEVETKEREIEKVSRVTGEKRMLEVNRDTKNKLKDLLTNISRENILKYQEKKQQKQEIRAIPYQIGDRVRIRLNVVQKNKLGGKKIASRNSRPYIVVEKKGEWTYLLVKVDEIENENAKIIRSISMS